jgi:hypothetical protein
MASGKARESVGAPPGSAGTLLEAIIDNDRFRTVAAVVDVNAVPEGAKPKIPSVLRNSTQFASIAAFLATADAFDHRQRDRKGRAGAHFV